MKESESEKYLGDVIHKTGNIQATINNRKEKGSGIVAEILSIINEIPLGKHRVEVALRLREAMLINGILHNSEAWHGVTDANIATLESLDLTLLKGILNAHSKTTKEFLYLETGAVPIRWILAQRRINFLKHILSRDDSELIKQVFLAQQEHPTRGDFVKLVEKHIQELGLTYEQVISNEMTKIKLKTHVRNVAFEQLLQQQRSHKKVKANVYTKFNVQSYLQSEILTQKEKEMLTALRSHCVRGIKHNFSKMYKNSLFCPLNCENGANIKEDTQSHILICKSLSAGVQIPLHDIYSDNIVNQTQITKVITKLMRKRVKLLEDSENSNKSLPGATFLDLFSRLQQLLGVPAVIK
jgi:hypothetical protein